MGHIPKAWKTSSVVPICKFGNSEQLVYSFRPISLLPCISKVMGKIIKSRLYWWLERNEKLSKDQGGFRNRLTKCNISGGMSRKASENVRLALNRRKVGLVVFIDLKSVDNKINHDILASKLQNLVVGWNMLMFCETYLRNREFTVFCCCWVASPSALLRTAEATHAIALRWTLV